jgi:predicted RNA-binding protein with PUA-like domain
MSYWLLKTDTDTYSFDDLQRDKSTEWDGVRNYQARNHLVAMKVGDECLIYHSGKDRCVMGTAKVTRAAYPDPKAEDPRWVNVDIKIGKAVRTPVTLAEMKAEAALSEMALIKQSRLSVCPMTRKEWQIVQKLAARA